MSTTTSSTPSSSSIVKSLGSLTSSSITTNTSSSHQKRSSVKEGTSVASRDLNIDLTDKNALAIIFAAQLCEVAERPEDAMYFLEHLILETGSNLSYPGAINLFAESAKMIMDRFDQGITIIHQCMKARRKRGTHSSITAVSEIHHEYLEAGLATSAELIKLAKTVGDYSSDAARKLFTTTVIADLYRYQARFMRPLKKSEFDGREIGFDVDDSTNAARKYYEEAEGYVKSCNDDAVDTVLFYYTSRANFHFEKKEKEEAIKVMESGIRYGGSDRDIPAILMMKHNIRVWKKELVIKSDMHKSMTTMTGTGTGSSLSIPSKRKSSTKSSIKSSKKSSSSS